MIIDQLNTLGAFVTLDGFTETSFEWTPDHGGDPVKFDIAVKQEASVADFEFVNMRDQDAPDRSVMARSVHRLVRVIAVNGEKADEGQLSLEDCNKLKPSLLLAFFIAIGEAAKKTQAQARGKAAPRRKAAK